MMVGVFVTFFALAVVIGLVGLAVSGARRRGAGEAGVDARSIRRFFQYVVLYALVVVVAIGVTELLGRLFGAEHAEWEDDGYLLAQGLAFVLVGLPLAGLLAWWTWRSHRRDPAETESGLYVAYVTLAALTSVVMAATSLQEVVVGFVDRGRLDGEAAAGLLAWGALWFGHWVAARRSLPDEPAAPHLLLGSLVGLILAASGLVMTLGTSLDLLLRPGVIGSRYLGLAEGGGLLLAGGLVWVRYWATTAVHLPRRTLWLALVLPIGVGGGLVMALVGASRLLWSVLVWLVGDRLGATATQHFDTTATEVAVLVVGALVWWYHRMILGADAGSDPATRTELRRVYEYLVAGIALVAAAIGVGTVLVAFIEAVTPGLDVGMTVLNTLLAALTLLVVGVPVWWLFWRRIRGVVAGRPGPEVASLTRRIYLVVLFGVAGVAAVVALIAVAFTFFQDVVDGQVGPATWRSMRYGLGTLVASAAVSAYHGTVFGQDRAAGAVARRPGPRSVVLVGAVAPELEHAISRATGARVEVWGRLDARPPAWDEEALLASLAEHPGEHLLVLADAGAPRVLVVDPLGRRSAAD